MIIWLKSWIIALRLFNVYYTVFIIFIKNLIDIILNIRLIRFPKIIIRINSLLNKNEFRGNCVWWITLYSCMYIIKSITDQDQNWKLLNYSRVFRVYIGHTLDRSKKNIIFIWVKTIFDMHLVIIYVFK